jgi:tyrosine-protein kinase Etk/Wzc
MTEDASLDSSLSTGSDDSIDLLQLFAAFVVEWRKFLLAVAVLFVLAVLAIYSITPLFEASASLLPQSKESSNDLASVFSGRSPGDVFIGLLSSRSVTDEVVDRAGLLQLYNTPSREIARKRLLDSSAFAVGKDTLVTIKVRDKRADAAMRIDNAYLDALQTQREKMLSEEADLHRRFFERQIAAEADALSAAERDLQAVQEHTGLVQPEAQTTAGITAIANVRTQITALQVQLASLLLSESEANPQVKDLRAQVTQLQGQEYALESTRNSSGAGAAAAAGKMPELNLDYTRKLRAVKYHETLLTAISSQYETTRLSEGYSGAPYVIVDRAIAPERKAWPPRTMMVLLAFAFSCVFGVVYVALALLWRKLNADPAHRLQLTRMRSSFQSRR